MQQGLNLDGTRGVKEEACRQGAVSGLGPSAVQLSPRP